MPPSPRGDGPALPGDYRGWGDHGHGSRRVSLVVVLVLGALSAEGVSASVVDTEDRSEVALVASVRARGSPDVFRTCVLDPACLRSSEDLLGAGRLPAPPEAGDLDRVVLDRSDLQPLRRCRLGDCPARLDAPTIEA